MLVILVSFAFGFGLALARVGLPPMVGFLVAGFAFNMAGLGSGPTVPLIWVIAGSSGVLGLGLSGYEIWRRRNRTVLVRDGDHIAVFRKGSLDLILTPDEITLVKPGLALMLKIAVCLGMVALMFTAIGIRGLLQDQEGGVDHVIILSLGLTAGFSLAAAARTRFFFRHLGVPIKGSRWLAEETVLVPSRLLKELFP